MPQSGNNSLAEQIRELRQLLAESRRPDGEGQAALDLFARCVDALDRAREELQFEQRALAAELQLLDRRIAPFERSLLFSTLSRAGAWVRTWKGNAGKWLLRSPLHSYYEAALQPVQPGDQYRVWLAEHRAKILRSRRIGPSEHRIKVSILLPVHRPRPDWLKVAIESVFAQSWQEWEICVALDGPISSEARRVLEEFKASGRVRVREASDLGHSGALNLCLSQASGDYVAPLDQDDFLEPFALELVCEAAADSGAVLVYTDEDFTDDAGAPVHPNFKPAWSPELLESCMYMGHLLLLSRERLLSVGGFRSRCDGAQDYDAVLRLIAAGGTARHVPGVCYHWRRHAGSTAQFSLSKPYTHQAGGLALQDHLAGSPEEATVEDGALPNSYRVRRHPTRLPSVSVLIPTRSAALLESCLRGIRDRTSYPHLEVTVIHHEGFGEEDIRIRDIIRRFEARTVHFTGPFHWSRMNNLAAKAVQSDVLVFCNDDTTPISEEWLTLMTLRAIRPAIGAVGARLLYPNGTLQHAGIGMGFLDAAGHPGRGLEHAVYWPWLDYTRNVSAVTGACMATRRELFLEMGGFDENFARNYNDVDYCLRVRARGLRVVLENDAVLTHTECASRDSGTGFGERVEFYRKWGDALIAGDPFVSQHLRRDDESLDLASGS